MPKSNKIKKLLTLEQLAQFCEQNKFYTFNSKDTGYTLSVQVPGYFEAENDSTKGLLFTKLRVCHTELNRNKSYISEENMKKAMPSLKYRPVLAKIHQLNDGTWDFHAHDMNFIENENGEVDVEYEEQQVGTFTADDPYLEYNKEYDKTYVMANAVIPEEYTKAAEIIRNKNGTKVSCELCIDSMSYNAKEKRLELEDFWFSGCTCLGAEKDGTQIGEGMEGSRLDIADFSTENNGIFKEDYQSRMIEALDKLNITLSNFNINELSKSMKEGGNEAVKLKELLEKYSKTEGDITFEVKGLSDEELEAKFVEVFGETEETANGENSNEETDDTETQTASEDGDDNSDNSDGNEEDFKKCKKKCEDDSDDSDDSDNNEEDFKKCKKKCENDSDDDLDGNNDSTNFSENLIRTYEISHEDIRCALYNLLSSYEESDNEWYFINSVYDTYFTYENWTGDKIYGQTYTRDGDNIAFDGERYNLHRELLTDSEYAELQTMRSNYASIKSQLEEYKAKELNTQKDALFSSDDYKGIAETEAYAELKKEAEKYSLEELTDKLDKIIAESVKKGTFSFVKEEQKPKSNRVNFAQTLTVDKPKKNSFLDGLLNKN